MYCSGGTEVTQAEVVEATPIGVLRHGLAYAEPHTGLVADFKSDGARIETFCVESRISRCHVVGKIIGRECVAVGTVGVEGQDAGRFKRRTRFCLNIELNGKCLRAVSVRLVGGVDVAFTVKCLNRKLICAGGERTDDLREIESGVVVLGDEFVSLREGVNFP